MRGRAGDVGLRTRDTARRRGNGGTVRRRFDLSAGNELDEFLGTLLHELRNRLAPLQSSLYLLQRAEPGGEQAGRMIANLDRQIRQLTALTDDLLDVTRLSRGKLALQCKTFDLCDFARKVVDENQALFAGSSLGLVVDVPDQPLLVHADTTRVAQVVGHLLNNAAKFSPAGSEVTLSVKSSPASNRASISVRDTGTGMNPELLSLAFEPFFRGDQAPARTQGGLGLGLALVKGLVEMHGGNVHAASDGPGQGATFTVELPLGPVERDVTPLPTVAPRTRCRVLVIEDNLETADSLREALQALGHVVETASDGRMGLSRARAFQPQVVLCDISLPEMDGYAVARAFRDEAQLRHAMLVAMTAYVQPEDRRRAAEAGFHEHLAKPPTIERLEEVLARAVLPMA
jgi:CheY-like chemotaxis protein/nitrogen-specific signal transduction histidine kinase